jgi:SAM-dependent methyltransferase
VRRARGRAELPPLWLRRHAGPLRAFESSARDMMALVRQLDLHYPGELVLDIGCGPGAMALEFRSTFGPEDRYLGIDVHAPSIRWCRRQFAGDSRFRFDLSRARSPYGRPRGPEAPFHIGLPDGAAATVLAKSLFTHLSGEQARLYLAEIARVLAPGRTATVSAFLFSSGGEVPAFPHEAASGRLRFRRRARPHAAVAFERSFFESMAAEVGLEVALLWRGFWPGREPRPTGQDVVFLRHPRGSQAG